MEKEVRARIQRATQEGRQLLEREFTEQLEGVYDIQMNGTVATAAGFHLAEDAQAQRARIKLVAAVAHHRAQGLSAADAVAALRRECAFTTFNRFVALKMLEAREIVLECVSRGTESKGFKEFLGLAPGLAGSPESAWRLYLECVFDEIGREVRVLFDRRDPASLLWPRRAPLDSLLEVLNSPGLASVWGEDETIGWVYQYFNGDDERKQMRAESQAPRNSRELAVRNQFFTPRYVVEFLTDNTLGQTWLEMRAGNTRLAEQCRFLVRRPNTIHMAEGAPMQHGDESAPLEQRTTYVSFRAPKDPRDIKVLDPASGSGHFLIYAFDLLLRIYEEAWEDVDAPPFEATGTSLRHDFPTMESLRLALPGLILRHNLHGVDIDPRAAQIAALALWMRAQKAWNTFAVNRAGRPLVTRTNVVTAEPMPGESDLLDEFCRDLEPDVVVIVRKVFGDMALAGEAGTLVRIEETVRQELERRFAPGGLYAEQNQKRWAEVEEKVYLALQKYAEAGRGYGRRLFSEDAARGFAFIDVCRGRYDVVLMNPPFGEATAALDLVLDSASPDWARNLLCAFLTRGRELAGEHGRVGAIYDRTAHIKSTYEPFRRATLLGTSSGVRLVMDLGWGVLDANVEVASSVIEANSEDVVVLDVRDIPPERKGQVAAVQTDRLDAARGVYFCALRGLIRLPNAVISGDFPQYLVSALASCPSLKDAGFAAYSGYTLKADQHNRLWWELGYANRQSFSMPMFNGAGHDPYTTSFVEAMTSSAEPELLPQNTTTIMRNTHIKGLPGLCFGKRGEFLSVHILPAGMLFTQEGRPLPVADPEAAYALLGYLNTTIIRHSLNLFCGQHKTSGYVNQLPWTPPPALSELTELVKTVVSMRLAHQSAVETDRRFLSPVVRGTIAESWGEAHRLHRAAIDHTRSAEQGWEVALEDVLGVDAHGRAELAKVALKQPSVRLAASWLTDDLRGYCASLVSWAFGVAFGRFDVLRAIKARQGAVDPDPFAPLPRYSPGMLLGDDGLPALRPPDGYPVPFPEDGILVDDPGHERDLPVRLRQVFTVAFGANADDRIREATLILDPGAPDLRQWLREAFFTEHILRYSKSRRKAPVYWRLGIPSGRYSVWVYFHRFGKDSLHRLLTDHVVPKLAFETKRLAGMLAEGGGTPDASQRKAAADQEVLVDELRGFSDEITRVAPLVDPQPDDGVDINAAPLHRLFGHTPSWQKECKSAWDSLCREECDWAHLAMRLWPERVVPKCVDDRSLAMAHGLADALWTQRADGKWVPREVSPNDVIRLIIERTAPAVKAALLSLEAADGAALPAHVPRRARAPSPPRPEGVGASRQLALPSAPPAPAGSVLNTLRAAFHQFPDPASRADLLAASGLDEASWKPAIDALVARGEVEKAGQARGTRYSLVHRPAPQS